jgi:sterol desaturase/sphingolipid hydroxylase (fatty acid hydroxylase superfamily)
MAPPHLPLGGGAGAPGRGTQPLALQFVEVLVVADLTQYMVHWLFHQVPWLWRFHAIHH